MSSTINEGTVSLAGQVAIVTGGGSGIGRSIVLKLSASGAQVVIADANESSAQAVVRECVLAGGEAVAVRTDVSSSADVTRLVGETFALRDRIDILVNCAAVSSSELVEDMSLENWKRVLDVNLTGAFLCTRTVLPHMLASECGKIVNIASIAGERISYNSGANYTAAKAGLLGFTRHVAYEVAGRNINVNAVCPGPTTTPLLESIYSEQDIAQRTRAIPRGRLATPEDTANAVLFLVSDLADMICGASINVDGGALLGWFELDEYLAKRRGE